MKKSRKIFFDTTIPYNEYEEWKEIEISDAEEFGAEILSDAEYFEQYCEYCRDNNDITRKDFIINSIALNDGEIIVAFADLGLWNCRANGFKCYGNNIAKIFDLVGCDDLILYLEDRNIKGELSHHDGTHYLTFRVIKDENVVDRMYELAEQGKITREYVMRNSKSLVPYTIFRTK